ncbi:AAA family ATPase [Labedella endophytica]|nr:AAA family ATPase [Labedella endophytica]
MLIWINGTFGVGKTHVAHELRRKLPGSTVSDPELPGFGIQRMYPPSLRTDFQDTPWWTPTVLGVLSDLTARHPGPVIVPMTLADPARFAEIVGGLRSAGVDTRHVALLASRRTIRRRVRSRFEDPDGWPMQRFDAVDSALRDDLFATHIETDHVPLIDVVETVAQAVGVDVAYSRVDRASLPIRRLRVTLGHIR